MVDIFLDDGMRGDGLVSLENVHGKLRRGGLEEKGKRKKEKGKGKGKREKGGLSVAMGFTEYTHTLHEDMMDTLVQCTRLVND